MALDSSRKMEMSLDEIIQYQQEKKAAYRARGTDDDSDEELAVGMNGVSPLKLPDVSMAPPEFSKEPAFFRNAFKRRQGGTRSLQGNYQRFNNFGNRNAHSTPIRKHYNGIPLLRLKRGMGLSQFGRPNSYMMWRQRCFGRNFMQKYYNNGFQLTSRNLNRFNKQNPYMHRRHGPGSIGSRGSLCSRCSGTSYRSNTSFRSNRSQHSLNPRSFSSTRSPRFNGFNRFKCELNLKIQDEIRLMQEKKFERIQHTSREELVDEPSKCRPKPESTAITCNLRFKQFIINPVD